MGGEFKVNIPLTHVVHGDKEIAIFISDFKSGIFKTKERFISDHARLAATIGWRINLEDGVSVAYETLCMTPDEVFEGRLIDSNLVGYLISRIKTRCTNHRRSDFVFRIPTTTAHRKNLTVKRITTKRGASRAKADIDDSFTGDVNESLMESFPDHSIEREAKLKEIYTDILNCAITEFESEVIKYRAKYYTDDEIAERFGCGRTKVREARNRVETRWEETREL